MDKSVTLFGIHSSKNFTPELKLLYPGSKEEDTCLTLLFKEGIIKGMHTSDKEEAGYENYLDLNLINPLELNYLQERFKSCNSKFTLADYEESLSIEILDYLKETNRLTENDYCYYLSKKDWDEGVRYLEIFCYFCFNDSVHFPGVRKGDDILIVVHRAKEILEIYSAFTDDDEWGREIASDRNKLNLKDIDFGVLEELKEWIKDDSFYS
jgi:hypothetical protein